MRFTHADIMRSMYTSSLLIYAVFSFHCRPCHYGVSAQFALSNAALFCGMPVEQRATVDAVSIRIKKNLEVYE